jgi:nitroimidazol reductase NimA-like FMN-containing flavoprotein (pyridoxamine 5'-phosphate oxidase superfamily)
MDESIFKTIRRQDRLLEESKMQELLRTAEYGFLSLGTSENGYAYGIPISYAYDEENKALYFHCAPEGHKLENMKANNQVSFCVVGKTQPIPEKFTTIYESVIAFGVADISLSEEEKRKALRLLVKKYCPEYIEIGEKYMDKSFHRTGAFKISIEHLTGKSKSGM